MIELLVFEFIVFLFSVIIHEVSHGFVAEKLGDPTARMMGRLTLNPIVHIDPIGSILVPIVTALAGFPFGWAKPVPYNPNNLKDPRVGGGLIALAGPAANLMIAFVFSMILRFGPAAVYTGMLPLFFSLIVYVNILLAVFNLVPIPPLDGSKVLLAIFPRSEQLYQVMRSLERYGFLILMLLIFLGGLDFIQPIIQAIFVLFVGHGTTF